MNPRVLPFARVALIVAGLWLVIPATGLAQGNGNGNGRPKAPKQDKPAPTPSPSPSPAPAPTSPSGSSSTATTTTAAPTGGDALAASPDVFSTVSAFRQFGSWLDDASAATPGEGQTSVGIGHWRMDGMTQTNFPMIGMGLGVTERLQISASLPFYHASYDGAVIAGSMTSI